MPSIEPSMTIHPYSFLKEDLKMPPGLSTIYSLEKRLA